MGAPLLSADDEEGTSKVRDLMPMIWILEKEEVSKRLDRWSVAFGVGGMLYFGGERGRFLRRAEKLGCFCSLGVFDFLVVEEANGGISPYNP